MTYPYSVPFAKTDIRQFIDQADGVIEHLVASALSPEDLAHQQIPTEGTE